FTVPECSKNKKVLLLDSGNGTLTTSRDAGTFSNRVSAINPGSRNFFEKIGVWENLCAITTPKIVRQLRVWDSCSTSKINFEHENFARDVAYIIENNRIVESCRKTFENINSNFQVKNQSKVTKLKLSENLNDLVMVELDDGSKFTTALLIGADGVNSKVRSTMNSHYVSWSYDQKAIVATLDINTVKALFFWYLLKSCLTGDNSIAWQRFTPTGPVALLPLTESKSSLVWTTTSQEAEALLTLPCDQFVDELNKILWEDKNQNKLVNEALSLFDTYAQTIVPALINLGISKVEQLPPTVLDVDPKSRAAFPLGFGHSTNYIAPRAVLIG
uniref:Ubiquinone biosynthesis monooxygenase COQ6 n=1 Tax=Romanomermis culicivorax TaxID=13658 RepID=A0A915L8X5_ROMCU